MKNTKVKLTKPNMFRTSSRKEKHQKRFSEALENSSNLFLPKVQVNCQYLQKLLSL